MNPKIEIINSSVAVRVNPEAATRLIQQFLMETRLPARQISVIIVSDEYLRKLHRDYLRDDTYTDVMTFNLSDDEKIEAEIYISGDRVRINAQDLNQPLAREAGRLIIHGLLHLKGMEDTDKDERLKMRKAENYHLDSHAELVSRLLSRQKH